MTQEKRLHKILVMKYLGGLEISIPEALGNPTSTDTIFIESYEGELRIHVWNGDEDPQTITLKKRNKHT